MSEPVKVNVVSYGGVKPGQFVVGNKASGERITVFDAATAVSPSRMFDSSMIREWDVDMPNLETCNEVFLQFRELTSFRGKLPKLRECNGFMWGCPKLRTFETELPSLENGHNLLYSCPSITEFNIALPALKRAETMFYNTSITSFEVDISTVESAYGTFWGCTKLTSFQSDLPVLTTGTYMFRECALDGVSIMRILTTIPSYDSGTHNLHLGKRTNFADSAESEEIAALLGTTAPIAAGTYSCKGWTITITD